MTAGVNKLEAAGCEEETSPAVVSRRTFLKYAVAAVGSFVGIVTGGPILGYLGSVFQAKGQAQWVKLGKADQFTEGAPQQVQFTLSRQDGWVEVQETRSCWVVRDGDKLAALNGRCTHLGCAYSWQQDGEHANHFYCPCHGGLYDLGGHVVDGPPPRALDRLETKEEDSDLYVMYQDFRPGVEEKVPL